MELYLTMKKLCLTINVLTAIGCVALGAWLYQPIQAWAQCTGVFPNNTFCGNQSGSPAPPNVYTLSSTPLPTVTDLIALQASSTVNFPHGVWRETFSTTLSTVPVFYQPSNSACSLNAGAGDNGSQVNSVDSKCWLAQFPASGADIREWGCVLDGTTDDTTCAQSATTWLKATGGPLVSPPQLTMAISGVLDISASNVSWTCASGGGVQHNASSTLGLATGCGIKWIGAGAPSGGYMITDIAPLGTTANGRLQAQHFVGFSFNGNSKANGALNVKSVALSDFGYFYATGFVTSGSIHIFSFDVQHITTLNFGDPCDTQLNEIHDIYIDQSNAAYTAPGILLGNYVNTTIPNNGCDASTNILRNIQMWSTNNVMIDDYGDSNHFYQINNFILAGTFIHLGVATDGSGHYSSANNEIFDDISGGSTATITVDGTATGCSVGTNCPTKIVFRDLNAGNSQVAPTLGTGIRPFLDVYWTFTNNTDTPWTNYTPAYQCLSGTLGAISTSLAIWHKQGEVVNFAARFTTQPSVFTCTDLVVSVGPSGLTFPSVLNSGVVGGTDITNSGVIGGWIDGSNGGARLRFSTNPMSGDTLIVGGAVGVTN
jgi:hypothetical protein